MIGFKRIFFVLILLPIAAWSYAQDTLPSFTVRNLSAGKAQISWVNTFDRPLVQLTVQRSFDSLKFFKTVYSAQSPWLPQNGFVDNSLPVGYKVYYRIQYVFEGGEYFFTKSKAPYDVLRIKGETNIKTAPTTTTNPTAEVTYINIYKRTKDSLLMRILPKDYKKFKDSIQYKTKDTLYILSSEDIVIKPFSAKVTWKASTNIFTARNGYVNIILPLAKQKIYKIIFFAETGVEVLRINHVKETELTLDKSNFMRSGWYNFELYEDDKLKEKNKIYLGKEF